MSRLAFLFFLGCTFLAACRPPVASPEPVPSKIVQWSGQQKGAPVAGFHVLRYPAEWTHFWQQVEQPPPRSLDLAREMAVVIFLGSKSTAGYSAEVRWIEERNGKLIVNYQEQSPAPGAMVAQVLTSPWVIAIVARSDLPVVGRARPSPASASPR